MDSPDELTIESLTAAADRLSGAMLDAEARIEAEQRKLALLNEEYRLISRLLDLRRGGVEIETPKYAVGTPTGDRASAKPPALDAALQELTSAGRPLHISEIVRALKERSVPIPGAGEQANLIALLTRDPRIVRPARGLYGLSEWGLDAPVPSAKTRKRRKHVRVHKTAS